MYVCDLTCRHATCSTARLETAYDMALGHWSMQVFDELRQPPPQLTCMIDQPPTRSSQPPHATAQTATFSCNFQHTAKRNTPITALPMTTHMRRLVTLNPPELGVSYT